MNEGLEPASVRGHAAILATPTPVSWLEAALSDLPVLLLDHANCEKKAASTAIALLFAYPEDQQMCLELSRLAREELRHFEQVTRLMNELGVEFRRLAPGRYAQGLRRAIGSVEPLRQRDLMLVGALIEARSCERFELLAPRLPERLRIFYAELARSEARHHELYLRLAARIDPAGWRARLAQLAEVEGGLITSPDVELRFHSGAPANGSHAQAPPTGPAN